MKIRIKQNIIIEHLNYVIRGISNKNLIPILNCINFNLTNEGLYLMSTDNDIKWYVNHEETILNRCGYAMIGKAAIFIDKVKGDYNTLFGISPSKIHDKIKELGYELSDFELR